MEDALCPRCGRLELNAVYRSRTYFRVFSVDTDQVIVVDPFHEVFTTAECFIVLRCYHCKGCWVTEEAFLSEYYKKYPEEDDAKT